TLIRCHRLGGTTAGALVGGVRWPWFFTGPRGATGTSPRTSSRDFVRRAWTCWSPIFPDRRPGGPQCGHLPEPAHCPGGARGSTCGEVPRPAGPKLHPDPQDVGTLVAVQTDGAGVPPFSPPPATVWGRRPHRPLSGPVPAQARGGGRHAFPHHLPGVPALGERPPAGGGVPPEAAHPGGHQQGRQAAPVPRTAGGVHHAGRWGGGHVVLWPRRTAPAPRKTGQLAESRLFRQGVALPVHKAAR
ncbi:hypothetical protein HPB47_002464, partial [Ixodes persulcatus]